MLNTVALIGFVSRPPRRIGELFSFPLAVYPDPDRQDYDADDQQSADRDVPDFPPVVMRVTGKSLPPFVRYRAAVRVEGWIHTRNRTESLRYRVYKDLIRAGMEGEKASAIANLVPRDLVFRTVEVEVVAERIFPEGWRRE